MPTPRNFSNQPPRFAGAAAARAGPGPNSASQYGSLYSAQQAQTAALQQQQRASAQASQQASSGYSSGQRPGSVASTSASTNGASASSTTAGPLQPLASMLLPLSDPFYFVLACVQCMKVATRPFYLKSQHAHECLKYFLLVKPVSSNTGSKYISGMNSAPDNSITRMQADVAKVGPNGWLLVRQRPQTMHSNKRDVFSGNYKFCECFTLRRNCRNGGLCASFLLIARSLIV